MIVSQFGFAHERGLNLGQLLIDNSLYLCSNLDPRNLQGRTHFGSTILREVFPPYGSSARLLCQDTVAMSAYTFQIDGSFCESILIDTLGPPPVQGLWHFLEMFTANPPPTSFLSPLLSLHQSPSSSLLPVPLLSCYLQYLSYLPF